MDSCFSGWKRGKKKSWKKSRLVKEKWKVDNAYLNRSRIDPCKIHSGSKSRTFCTRPQSWNRNFLFEPRISLARNCGRRGEGIRRRLARDRSIFSRDGSQEHEKWKVHGMNFSRGIASSHAVSIPDRTTRKLSLTTIFTGNLYFNSFHLLLGNFNFISLSWREKKKWAIVASWKY